MELSRMRRGVEQRIVLGRAKDKELGRIVENPTTGMMEDIMEIFFK